MNCSYNLTCLNLKFKIYRYFFAFKLILLFISCKIFECIKIESLEEIHICKYNILDPNPRYYNFMNINLC